MTSFVPGGLDRTVAREALGMVETRGWVGAVEAADTMCKTAGVRLARYEVTRDTLVTVIVRGPLAEVEAAVAAGASSAERVGELLTRHVIPAPEPELEDVILSLASGEGIPGMTIVP
jgi:microcompartment protein CcmL/EutN